MIRCLPILISAVWFVFGVVTDARINSVEAAGDSGVVESIKDRGFVLCGIRDGVRGFSVVDKTGKWSGMDVDFCAALAAAVLGSKDAVQYRPLSAANRYGALTNGDIDVLSGGGVWTMTRDTELGVRFVGALFHDGQVFLTRKDQAVSSALELSGTIVCVLDGTRAGQGVSRFFEPRQMSFKLVAKKRWEDAVAAYKAGDCNVLSGDMSVLAVERLGLADPDAHQILREVVSKEPLGSAVKSGDETWFSIVRWTLMALLEAEELGITSQNFAESKSKGARERQLMGLSADLGAPVGLARDWALQVVSQVGNYSEMFERNLGGKSPLKLGRGINALWNRGGIMYGVPLR